MYSRESPYRFPAEMPVTVKMVRPTTDPRPPPPLLVEVPHPAPSERLES
jgi:hypothetical protein